MSVPSTTAFAPTGQSFADFPLEVGDGRAAEVEIEGQPYIRLPDTMKLRPGHNNLDGLLDFVYQDARWGDVDWWRNRAVLTLRDAHVQEVNERMMKRLPPGEVQVALSADRLRHDIGEYNEISDMDCCECNAKYGVFQVSAYSVPCPMTG